VIGAETRTIAEWAATIAISHQQTPIAESEQVRREAIADRVRFAPSLATVGRLRLQRPMFVHFVVIADLRDDCPVRRLDGMQFVIGVLVPRTDRYLSKPVPRYTVVFGLTDSDLTTVAPELFAGIQQPSVSELDRAVRAVNNRGNSSRP
jgi:hypothetical protein